MLFTLMITACVGQAGQDKTAKAVGETESELENMEDRITSGIVIETEADKDIELHLTLGDTPVEVQWEDNESVKAIRELTSSSGLEINMSMYGGFEQVGPIGQSIPRNDEQTTTKAGDIVLYSGNQIVVFYGSNSWSYTRLGKITDKTEQELTEMLGNGDVVLKFEVN